MNVIIPKQLLDKKNDGEIDVIGLIQKVYNVENISGDIFFEYIDTLRRHASKESGKLLCPLMCLMQIESWC